MTAAEQTEREAKIAAKNFYAGSHHSGDERLAREYAYEVGYCHGARAARALPVQGVPEGWRSIESAPRDRPCAFWVVPKTADETYLDSSGKPILSGGKPHMVYDLYGRWGSLSKAVLWHALPLPPTSTGGELNDF